MRLASLQGIGNDQAEAVFSTWRGDLWRSSLLISFCFEESIQQLSVDELDEVQFPDSDSQGEAAEAPQRF